VTGGKRDCLVEEKEFRITARRHHLAIAAFELKNAGNPTVTFVLTHDFLLLIV